MPDETQHEKFAILHEYEEFGQLLITFVDSEQDDEGDDTFIVRFTMRVNGVTASWSSSYDPEDQGETRAWYHFSEMENKETAKSIASRLYYIITDRTQQD